MHPFKAPDGARAPRARQARLSCRVRVSVRRRRRGCARLAAATASFATLCTRARSRLGFITVQMIALEVLLPGRSEAQSAGNAVVPWLLSHPLATAGCALVLYIAVPKVTQALWRYLIGPAFLFLAGYFVIEHPQETLQTFNTAVAFSSAYPVVASSAIIALFLLLIAPHILPLLLAAILGAAVLQPSMLTSKLPSLPSVPSWAVPAPFQSVRKEASRIQTEFKQTELKQTQRSQGAPSAPAPGTPQAIKGSDAGLSGRATPEPARSGTPGAPPTTVNKPDVSSAPAAAGVLQGDRRPSRSRALERELDADFQIPSLAPEGATAIPSKLVTKPSRDGSDAPTQADTQPQAGALARLRQRTGSALSKGRDAVANAADSIVAAAEQPGPEGRSTVDVAKVASAELASTLKAGVKEGVAASRAGAGEIRSRVRDSLQTMDDSGQLASTLKGGVSEAQSRVAGLRGNVQAAAGALDPSGSVAAGAKDGVAAVRGQVSQMRSRLQGEVDDGGAGGDVTKGVDRVKSVAKEVGGVAGREAKRWAEKAREGGTRLREAVAEDTRSGKASQAREGAVPVVKGLGLPARMAGAGAEVPDRVDRVKSAAKEIGGAAGVQAKRWAEKARDGSSRLREAVAEETRSGKAGQAAPEAAPVVKDLGLPVGDVVGSTLKLVQGRLHDALFRGTGFIKQAVQATTAVSGGAGSGSQSNGDGKNTSA